MSNNDRKPADVKQADRAFGDLIRDSHKVSRVRWVPPPSSADPEVHRRDRQVLNDALRRAGRRAQGYRPEEDDDVA